MPEMEEWKSRELPDPALTPGVKELLSSRLHKRGIAICLSGIDGSGKTTLARELVQVLEASGVPVRYLHLHQWYLNVSVTPALLLYNKYFGCKVLVFDRSIYDNIAVASLRRYWPRWLSRVTLKVVLACYPRYDHRLYLVIAFNETLLRRPSTGEERFMLLSKVYEEIVHQVKYIRLTSNAHLFVAALREIVRGP